MMSSHGTMNIQCFIQSVKRGWSWSTYFKRKAATLREEQRQQQDAHSSATSLLAALAHLDPGVHLLLLVVGLLVLRAGVSLQLLHAGGRRGKEGCYSRTKRQSLPLLAARGLRSGSFIHCSYAGPPVDGGVVWAPGRRFQQQRGRFGSLPACRMSVVRSGRSVLLLGARPTDTVCPSVCSWFRTTPICCNAATPPSGRF